MEFPNDSHWRSAVESSKGTPLVLHLLIQRQQRVQLFVTMPKMAQFSGKWFFLNCPLAIKSIGETLSQNIRDQERGKIGPASLLHSWHWVLFPISIEAFVLPQLLLFYVAFSSPLFSSTLSWTPGLHQLVLDFALVFRNHTLAASAQLFPARLTLNWKYSLVNSGRQTGREGVPEVPEVDLFSGCEVGQKVIKSPLERFQFHFQSM